MQYLALPARRHSLMFPYPVLGADDCHLALVYVATDDVPFLPNRVRVAATGKLVTRNEGRKLRWQLVACPSGLCLQYAHTANHHLMLSFMES